jgi:hypothetical protein
LSALNDDYSAAYDSTDAFGRIDPIKVYKSTSRRISLTFIIAALDDNDFNHMWMKINKLVTLVYPQFTEGRMLELNGANKFIRPFTQQIAASPMIRLRVGDLVSSNYSRFNLAGIFGLRRKDIAINGYNIDGDAPRKQQIKEDAEAAGRAAAAAQATKDVADEQKKLFGPSAEAKYDPSKGYDLLLAQGNYPEDGGAKNAQIVVQRPDDYSARIITVLPAPEGADKEKQQYKVQLKVNHDVNFSPPDPKTKGSSTPRAIAQVAALSAAVDGKYFIVTKDKLREHTIASQKRYDADKAKAELDSTNADAAVESANTAKSSAEGRLTNDTNAPSDPKRAKAQFTQTLTDFMKPENNVVVRSFESAGGKGLAGFIDSINFDWMSGTWSTISGATAPKLCRVTISFSPVHDIAPGLDSTGYNRAPVYPVGIYSKMIEKPTK